MREVGFTLAGMGLAIGIAALAATPAVVPRGNGEGSLGVNTCRWGNVYGTTGEFSRLTVGGSNVVVEGNVVTNGGVTINGSALGNGTNLTITGGSGIDGATGTQIVHNVTDGPFLAVTQAINAATQTIAGASVVGAVASATVAATATNLSDGQTTVSIFTDPGYSTNAMRVGPDGDATTYLEIDGLSQRMTYVYGGVTRWNFGIGQTPSSFKIDNSAYSYLFGASGNVLTNGQTGVTLTGTLTPTNELTVTNSLQLGGVDASGYVTGGVFSVGTVCSNVAGTLYIPTNSFGGGTGGGTDGAAVTNIAKDIAFGARPAYTLTSAATVTIPRYTGTNHFVLTCTNSTVTLGVATGSWALADFQFYTLSINRGTNTLAFDTASITNSTVLDVGASTDKTLMFLKPYNSYQHRVRE
jgi:hypothetical protein